MYLHSVDNTVQDTRCNYSMTLLDESISNVIEIRVYRKIRNYNHLFSRWKIYVTARAKFETRVFTMTSFLKSNVEDDRYSQNQVAFLVAFLSLKNHRWNLVRFSIPSPRHIRDDN